MSAPSSFTLLADVMVTRKVTFMDRQDMEHMASGSKDGLVSTERSRLMSHSSDGFTTSGKVLMRPYC